MFSDATLGPQVAANLGKLLDAAVELRKAELGAGKSSGGESEGDESGEDGDDDDDDDEGDPGGEGGGAGGGGGSTGGGVQAESAMNVRDIQQRRLLANRMIEAGEISDRQGQGILEGLADQIVPVQLQTDGVLAETVEERAVRAWLALGFDARCLAQAAASVSFEDVLDVLRGPISSDGGRIGNLGLYQRYGIPDSISGRQPFPSWRSWIAAELPSERDAENRRIGGGWAVDDRAGERFVDFWRFPISPTESGQPPLILELLADLSDLEKSEIIVEQILRAFEMPQADCMDVALTLAVGFREFGGNMLPGRRNRGAQVNSLAAGGFDFVSLGPLRNQGFLRRDAMIQRAGGINEAGEETRPVRLRRDTIMELALGLMAYHSCGEDRVLSLARRAGLLGDAEVGSVVARRIWTVASFAEPGNLQCLLLPDGHGDRREDCPVSWPAGVPRSFEAPTGWYDGAPSAGDVRRRVAIKRAQLSAAEAAALDTLLLEPARRLCAANPPDFPAAQIA